MKLKKKIKNDWNQPGLTFRTCDTNYEIELQHKRQTKKKIMSNFQLAQIIRDKIVKTNLKKDQKEKMCVCV
jgi:hypothetical protein